MKRLLFSLLFGVALAMAVRGITFAADQTHEFEAHIGGSEIVSLTNIQPFDTFVYTDPGTVVGEAYQTFDDSYDVWFDMLDNFVTPSANAPILKIKISGGLPDPTGQYGNTYSIVFREWSGGGAYQYEDYSNIGVDELNVVSDWTELTGTDETAYSYKSGAEGDVLYIMGDLDLGIWIRPNKRIYGDTSSTFTITLTFIDT